MRKLYRPLALLALPLFVLRLLDVILDNIDLRTGFSRAGGLLKTILILVVIFGAAGYQWFRARKISPAQNKPAPSVLSAILLFFSAVGAVAGSIGLLTEVFQRATWEQLFLSKQKLFAVNITDTHFRIEFWCALCGFLAAAWFLFAAIRMFQNGDLSGQPIFCCVPILWYCLRTLSDYALSPNPYNTFWLTSIAVNMILALLFLQYMRAASLHYPESFAVKLAPYALLAFLFAVSFQLPVAPLLVQRSLASFTLSLVDVFAAVAVFVATDLAFGGEKPA